MRPWSPDAVRQAAAAKPAAAALADHVFAQALSVQARGLAAILTLQHLAVQTGSDRRALRAIVARRRRRPYRFFWMAKRRGGKRRICMPEAALLGVQRWLVKHVLNPAGRGHGFGAYAPGCSPL